MLNATIAPLLAQATTLMAQLDTAAAPRGGGWTGWLIAAVIAILVIYVSIKSPKRTHED